MPSRDPALADESVPYGFGKDVLKALNVFLEKKDPKEARANRKNSSAARAQHNALERLSSEDILVELLRRRRVETTRVQGRERKRRWRERQARARRAAALS